MTRSALNYDNAIILNVNSVILGYLKAGLGKIVSSGLTPDVLSFDKLEETNGCKLLVDESPLGEFPRVTLVPGRYMDSER